MTGVNDGAYKQFFSHPIMVRELLQGFVHEDWVTDLDFSTLDKLNPQYISDKLNPRHDDIVWRVRTRKGQSLYIYLLLEFQSRSDPWMALRLMTYVGLLYQDLIKSRQVSAGEPLPPVFPLVLYNGERRWTAAMDMSQLIAAPNGHLAAYQPRFRYYLFDEGRVATTAVQQSDSLVASLVRMETSNSPMALRQEITRLTRRLHDPSYDSLRRAFAVWINRAILRRMMPNTHIPELGDLMEIDAMLSERVVTWTEQWKQEGLEAGRQEGQVELLLRQMNRRYGPVPEWAAERLRAASRAQLDSWAEAIFDAPTLEALLGE